MSKVKFGKSQKTGDQVIERQFGKNEDRVTYWKFGEDTRFYIFDKLKDYLPKFIVQNELCQNILRAIAIEIVRVQNKLKKLPLYVQSGFPGFKFANSDMQLFISENATQQDLKTALYNTLSIHRERGTVPGILKDIKRLTNDKKAVLKYYPYYECGWIIGKTYPMYNAAGKRSPNTNVRIGLDNMLEISFCNRSLYTDKRIKEIIREQLVPLVINVRVILNLPHVVAFGEPIDNFSSTRVKFGTFKFGEIRGGCNGVVAKQRPILEPAITEN